MSTRDEILAAAVREVRERDESAFRVTIVAKNAGCATSVLYHYFGSREGLIDAALVQIVIEESNGVREALALASQAAETSTDAIEMLVNYVMFAHSPDRRADRSLRARLLGAAQTRPTVRRAFQEFGRLSTEANRNLLTTLADKGLIRKDLDIRALALTLRSLDFGWVLDEVNDDSEIVFEDWIAVMRELAVTLATPKNYLDFESAD
jgi:AcrR family transcriptional regulator